MYPGSGSAGHGRRAPFGRPFTLFFSGIALLPMGAAAFWWANEPTRPEPSPHGGQLTASIRAEPRSYNRLVARDHATELISLLTQGQLVRINRASFALEPWLADRWDSSSDGLTHTLHLRANATWSDGVPVTTADVLFSLEAAYDPKSGSVVGDALKVGGAPLEAAAIDAHTVTLRFPAPSGPGLRLLDNLVILPRHKLARAFKEGRFATAWNSSTPASAIVGTGPFVVDRYEPGQHVVLRRNPRYWRTASDGTALPYLDSVVLKIVPDQNTEVVQLLNGSIDLTQNEVRPEDYRQLRQAERAGTLTVSDLGVGTDADALWFCLNPDAKRADARFSFVQQPEFRQAISHAVNRRALVDTVFLGAGTPIWGPVTPGNTLWYSPRVRQYSYDEERARQLLSAIGLRDRDGNGIAEDERGVEARFSVITQAGITSYERGTTVVREALARVGIELQVVGLAHAAVIQRLLACDYDAIYFRPLQTDLDPAGNLDFWLSSGDAHVWNIGQPTPATEWEERVDALMLEQASTTDPERRRQVFDEVQHIVTTQLPVLHFAAPRLYYAHNARVIGIVPSVMRPAVLWNADVLRLSGNRERRQRTGERHDAGRSESE